MNIDKIIQLIRTCSIAQVRATLEVLAKRKETNESNGSPYRQDYDIVREFYEAASKQPKK